MADDHAAVLAANEAYYAAFESGDVDALDELWEISDRVVCTHPGWRTLHGWAAVRTSYARIFENQTLQFIVTSVDVHVDGDVAWVTCDENIWGGGGTGTVAALNLFSRSPVGDGWKLVAHHASPVAPTQDEHPDDQETS